MPELKLTAEVPSEKAEHLECSAVPGRIVERIDNAPPLATRNDGLVARPVALNPVLGIYSERDLQNRGLRQSGLSAEKGKAQPAC